MRFAVNLCYNNGNSFFRRLRLLLVQCQCIRRQKMRQKVVHRRHMQRFHRRAQRFFGADEIAVAHPPLFDAFNQGGQLVRRFHECALVALLPHQRIQRGRQLRRQHPPQPVGRFVLHFAVCGAGW